MLGKASVFTSHNLNNISSTVQVGLDFIRVARVHIKRVEFQPKNCFQTKFGFNLLILILSHTNFFIFRLISS